MFPEYEKLIVDFVAEADDLIEKVETNLLELENGYDLTKVHTIFRAVHTIKGNSGMFEFQNIRDLAHKMETILDLLRSEKIPLTRELMDLLLQALDRLKQILGDVKNESQHKVGDLVQQIEDYRNTHNMEETVNLQEQDAVFSLEEMIDETSEDFSDYISIAGDERKSLYKFNLDLNKQTFKTMKDFLSYLEAKQSFVIHKQVRESEVPSLSKESLKYLPYTILVLCEKDNNPREIFSELELESVQSLYSPQQIEQAQKSEALMPIEKAAEHNTVNSTSDTFVKVKINLLDDLINLVGETIITRNQLLQRASILNDSEGNVILSRMSQLITQLHEKIMHTRLQELSSVYSRITRVVRDTSKSLGKKVVLDLDGGDVELDKTMIDTILDALVHILRNSIDHGIESVDERKKANKPEAGKISISASLQTGNVRIVITDDGRGLNLEKIRNSAVSKGVISLEESKKISKEEIEELVFLPGITTKEKVTETSGRGVGMDAVRTSFKKLGGNVHLTSQEGKGTTIYATIPQTVSVISCLLISVNQRRFAMFQKYISELIQFDKSLYSVVNGHKMYRLREKLVPIVHLGELLAPNREVHQTPNYIVIVRSDNYYFGLLFDEMLGTEEIVIKPLGEHFSGVKLFSGATIMGDGEAVLILDVFGIADFIGLQSYMQDIQVMGVDAKIRNQETGYLLFESSNQQFAVITSSVVCIEKIQSDAIETISGIEVIQYKGGIVPIVYLEDTYSIHRQDTETECYVIIINIESCNYGVVIHRIIDVVNEIHIIDSQNLKGEAVVGHSIINHKTTIVIDIISLLEKIIKEKFMWLGEVIESTATEQDIYTEVLS
jgi:two-component system, chemotaxis family, sensor kinase CheA